jgi:glucan 1,3-beta-glucosidase
MAWFQVITGSSNLYIYGSGFWTFFNDDDSSCGTSCQTNAVDVASTSSLYYYGLNARSNVNLVYYNGAVLVTQNNNPGGWGKLLSTLFPKAGSDSHLGAVVAAFLWDS